MARSTGKKSTLESLPQEPDKDQSLLDECQQHEADSFKWLQPMRDTWDEKESMLLVKLEDSISKTKKSKVYDPVLSTAVIERGARVMSQPASGKAFAVSKNDVGKNMLMNLLLDHYGKNANEEYSFLLKQRFLDIYSNVYGSFFGLVPWRVNLLNGYVGPELLPINMRDVRPQPYKRSPDKSDWFGVRSMTSIEWLKSQDPGVWMNVDNLAAELKATKSSGDTTANQDVNKTSYTERERYPNYVGGDTAFPQVEMFTEYRSGVWITWTPRQIDNDKSRPWILRKVVNPYPYGMLPIVVKHGFPLLDSMIGLGEFERGKTLQFAINSLINLYLDGVKYSIFPPLHINLNEVVPSSIKWESGGKMYMNHPNQDVQVMNMRSGEWLNTFQSTYGFLISAIQNLSGSSQVAQMSGASELAQGKTPEAIKSLGFKESARDEWDRFMMEETIQQIYDRWVPLLTHNLDVPQTVRVFGPEIADIQTMYPKENILEVFQSKSRGNVKVSKKQLNDGKEPTRYDFEIVTGSTMKSTNMDEGAAASDIIRDIVAAPILLEKIRSEGKDIVVSELYKRKMIGGGLKDWDKILVDLTPAGTGAAGTPAGAGAVPNGAAPQPGQEMAGQPAQPAAPVAPAGGAPQFKDQEIQQAAMQIMGGVSGIPQGGAPA